PQAASTPQGLTLRELQVIGREAGLDSAAVARAAAALESRALQAPERTSLGMPIEVTRVVPLPRAPTAAEWEQLVGELRSTFGARGKAVSQGGLKEWANGNLHACVEPSADGYRLRLGTVKGDARTLNAVGSINLLAGAGALSIALATGGVSPEVFAPAVMAATGVAAFGANILRLPRWADTRRRQMDFIAARIGAIMDASPRALE
ncbi:MAG: hypothetical protein ICV87_14145, partial [Gemmatimonadetes bacterium]|nr:hypothetical protein [Gemmatimonadota bacterium]